MDVQLVDFMGSDSAIVQAARVSYGEGTKTVNEDKALIRYLMRHWHTTPFEMVEFKFRIKCPIFVARQHMRHRMSSINEYSARYSIVKDEYWIPREFRLQGSINKQGSNGVIDDDALKMNLYSHYVSACEKALTSYKIMIENGVAREIARCVLPQSMYTEFYWKIDLHNLLHYLRLRLDDHAQEEIRDLARMIYEIVKEKTPIVAEAFEDFRLNTVTFTGPEIRGDSMSSGEKREYKEKCKVISNGKQCIVE
jgi:thymidylate synthase (FAD)